MNSKRGTEKDRPISSFYPSCTQRGQVTVFIIIGIIILFTFAGILFATRTFTETPLLSEAEPVIADVPTAFAPVQRYTENCLSQVGKRGLVLLGQHGGYIYPDVIGTYSSTNPTDGDGIDLESGNIPYWYYNAEQNAADAVTTTSLQPVVSSDDDPTLSMEAQLARFVEEQLSECLNEYAPFIPLGFILQQLEAPKVEATITNENVRLLLEMPLDVAKGDADTSLQRFFVKIPLRLQYYYDIADRITDAQEEHKFLERQGLELLSVYSQKDIDYFPPTSDVSYDLFSVLSWNEQTLKQKYKDLLTSYIPMLRFLGSSNFYYTTFPQGNILAQKVSDNMVLPLTGADDLEVSFDYFGWEPYFKTNSDDGVIKPEHIFVNYNILTFGTQRYETHYDISYPVMVTIKDTTAFGGEGYTFVFALESNIRNNNPAETGVREPSYRPVSPIACNPEQRSSALLKTVVVDSFTKQPLDLVKIGFSIPEQTDCEMGITGRDGTLESTYPSVYGGVVNFIKEGYLTNFYPIDTYKYKDNPVLLGYAIAEVDQPEKVIELDRVVDKSIRVIKKELKKCITPLECKRTVGAGNIAVDPTKLPIPYNDISCEAGKQQCFFNGGSSLLTGTSTIQVTANGSLSKFHDYYFINKEEPLRPEEEVVITLERVGGFHEELVGGDFTTVIATKGDEPVTVQLVPGVYKVNGFVTVREKLEIPTEQRCFQYDLVGYEKKQCFTMESISLEDYIVGNFEWNLPETFIQITPEDLYTSNEIIFSVLVQDLASAPAAITIKSEKCGSFLCLGDIGCAFESCKAEEVSTSGRVVEDLQIIGKMIELANRPEIRAALEPVYK
ncbi:MAG: hypothetical protein Q8R37_05025 [Nanoarchaeota archaeon]|nr:hypothetical protein [Nanoarchaeota archaeon]